MGRKKNSIFSASFILFSLTVLLCLIGLFFVFEASVAESYRSYGHPYHFLRQHSFWLVVGFGALGIAFFTPTNWWYRFAPLFYILGVVFLASVFVPGFGIKLNGASRWVDLGFSSFQPVEFFKLAVVVFYASWLKEHQRLEPFLFLTAFPAIILLLQPDMGSLLVVLAITFGMFFVAGGNVKKLTIVSSVGILLLLLAVISSPYRLKRLTTYLNPNSDPLGASFHIKQIILALGNGHWFGQGLGNSKQRFSYIPEASSDSIFAIVAEEVGFVGSSVLIFIYALYFYFGAKVAMRQKKNKFAQLLAVGLLLWISAQTILNLFAIVALVPLTGLPLPFISYGGSSLVMTMLASGILIRVALNKKT